MQVDAPASHVNTSQHQESYIFKLFVNILKILCKQILIASKIIVFVIKKIIASYFECAYDREEKMRCGCNQNVFGKPIFLVLNRIVLELLLVLNNICIVYQTL